MMLPREALTKFSAALFLAAFCMADAWGTAMALTLTSPAFKPQGPIPAKYTCEGDNVSPPLSFDGVPQGAKSLALILDDPDAPDPAAPTRVWVHWVVYNIPPDARGLPADAGKAGLPQGAAAGVNESKHQGYDGPCPPIGRHRYFYTLYALDTTLDLKTPNKAALEAAIHGHVMAKAELIGTFQKGDR
jgi:Raf kinase inhibitor-like YbhB/YbcL family protein